MRIKNEQEFGQLLTAIDNNELTTEQVAKVVEETTNHFEQEGGATMEGLNLIGLMLGFIMISDVTHSIEREYGEMLGNKLTNMLTSTEPGKLILMRTVIPAVEKFFEINN